MLATEEKLDLCSTCNDTILCIPNSRRPVLFCEQFDNFVPISGNNKEAKKTKISAKFITIDESEDFKFLGLCINCDFRVECPLAKKEGGVWHCEEYR